MPSTTDLGDLPIPLDADPLADVYNFIRQLGAALDTEIIRKSADETVTSSTVLQADNHLLFDAVAGKTYVGEMHLVINSPSLTPDFKCGITFPAGTFSLTGVGTDPAATTASGDAYVPGDASLATGTTAFIFGTYSGGSSVHLYFSYVCTTSGQVKLLWAQNTSDANGVTVKAGSWLKVQVA